MGRKNAANNENGICLEIQCNSIDKAPGNSKGGRGRSKTPSKKGKKSTLKCRLRSASLSKSAGNSKKGFLAKYDIKRKLEKLFLVKKKGKVKLSLFAWIFIAVLVGVLFCAFKPSSKLPEQQQMSFIASFIKRLLALFFPSKANKSIKD